MSEPTPAPPPEEDTPSFIATFTREQQDPAIVKQVHARVSEILTAQEEIRYIAVQAKPVVNLAPDCVVLTNRRFIIYKPKMLGRVSFVDFIWRDLRDARLREGLMGATLTMVTTKGPKIEIEYLPKSQARRLYAFAQEMEENVREERRLRELEEKRAAAGGVILNQPSSNPEPVSASPAEDPVQVLSKLKQMLDAGLIKQSEYDAKKSEILSRM